GGGEDHTRMMRVMGHSTNAVVLAKARTHYPDGQWSKRAVATPASNNIGRWLWVLAFARTTRERQCLPSLRLPAVQLRQRLDDLLLAVDDLGEEAGAVDVAVLVPACFHQHARRFIGRQGQAIHRGAKGLAVELADFLRDVFDEVDRGIALDAVVIGPV